MHQLICEGKCNPGIAGLDEDIRVARRGSERIPLTEYLIEKQRRLRYTPHVWAASMMYKCQDCGQERRY